MHRDDEFMQIHVFDICDRLHNFRVDRLGIGQTAAVFDGDNESSEDGEASQEFDESRD
jgi:hypothetical protein